MSTLFRFSVLVIMMLLCASFAIAQPDTVWTATYGTEGNEEGWNVLEKDDGDLIVVGGRESKIYQLSSTGNLEWTMEDATVSYYRGICESLEGDGFVVCGFDYSGISSICKVRKYLWDQTLDWADQYQPSSWMNSTKQVMPAINGGYIVNGHDSNAAAYGNDCLTKYSETGNREGYYRHFTNGRSGNAIAYSSIAGYLLVGNNKISSGDNYSHQRLWLERRADNGDVIWEQSLVRETAKNTLYGIKQYTDNIYYVCGQAASGGDVEGYIARLEETPDSMVVVWEYYYPNTGAARFWDIDVMPDGGCVAAGFLTTVDSDTDVVVARLDPAGNLMWSDTYGGENDDEIRKVQVLSDDGILLVGTTASYGAGGYDAWVIRLEAENQDIGWTEHTIDGSFDGAYDVFAADVDGDGDPDVLGAAYNEDITWWENSDGLGTTWVEHVVSSGSNGARGVYVSDVDGDGDEDILGAENTDNSITWWENSNNIGTSWIEHIVDNTLNNPSCVFAADVDGDGDVDVVGSSQNDDMVLWWENTIGNGTTWISHIVDDSFDSPWSIYIMDMDNDGNIDIVGAGYSADDICWWENTNGNGMSWLQHDIDNNIDGIWSTCAKDIDGDSDQDVLGAAFIGHIISWWENTNDAGTTWVEHPVDEEMTYATSVYSIDVDNDGDNDIIGASWSDEVVWWENTTGDGTVWNEHTIDSGFNSPSGLFASDIDGDGDIDVLGAAEHGDEIAWWENDLNPNATALTCEIPSEQWTLIGIPAEVTNGSFAALFADDLPGTPGRDFRISYWNEANNTYIRYGEADHPVDLGQNPPSFAPGIGVWIYQNLGYTATLDITAAQLAGATNEGASCLVPLAQGDGARTMIANPFNYISDWRRMRIYDSANDQRFSIFAAAQDSRMNSYAYTYDGVNEQWEQVNCYGTSNVTLDTWEGFFVVQTDATNSYQLEMMPANLLCGDPEGADFELDEPGEFTLPLVVRTSDDIRRDTHNALGIHSFADDQYDGLDAFEFTPRSPEFVQLYFDHNDWNHLPDVYTYDYRSADFSGGSKTWYFTVRTWQLPGEELELIWPGVEDVDDAYELLLYTPDNTEIDLRTADSYNFTSENEADSRQDFMIVCRFAGNDVAETEAMPVNFGIHDLYPNPFNDQVRISYGLPEAGDVKLTVFNILGQQVARLAEGNRTAGLHHTQWHAKNMASGVYLVKLEVQGRSSIRKVQLLR